jgi:hypothetical protein
MTAGPRVSPPPVRGPNRRPRTPPRPSPGRPHSNQPGRASTMTLSRGSCGRLSRAPAPRHHRLRRPRAARPRGRARPRPAGRSDPERRAHYARYRLTITPGPPSWSSRQAGVVSYAGGPRPRRVRPRRRRPLVPSVAEAGASPEVRVAPWATSFLAEGESSTRSSRRSCGRARSSHLDRATTARARDRARTPRSCEPRPRSRWQPAHLRRRAPLPSPRRCAA